MSIALLFGIVAALVTASSDDCAAQISAQVAGLPDARQGPARDTSAPKKGTSRIKGRVLAADGGTPVRRALVSVSSSELRDTRSVMTDGEGRYDIGDLPAGTYRVYASKTGFIRGQAGGSAPGDLGRPVRVGDREVVSADDVLLSRAAAIEGRVVDEFGDPVAGAQLRLFQNRSVGGVRRPMIAGDAITNDLGQYRAYGLAPGSYFVSVAPGTARMGGGEVGDHVAYAPTYYPGTANFDEAVPIQLTSGQDMTADIALVLVRTARVSGVALDAHGRPAANANVFASLVQAGSLMNAGLGTGAFARVEQDGTFTLRGMAPGDYTLELTVNPSPPSPATGGSLAANVQPREFGRARVSVGGDDLSGIAIQTSTGATITGHVVFEGVPVPASKARLSVTAQVMPGAETFGFTAPGASPAPVAADGTFTLAGVFGDRVFRLGGLPSGWVVKAIYVSGRDTIDAPVSLDGREQLTGVQIVVTDRITHVAVTVADDEGHPAENAYVVIVPDDPARLTPGSRFVRTMVVSSASVPAKFDGMPPSAYVGVAFKGMPQGVDVYDPDLFDRLRKIGTRFSLREGETRDVTLKIASLPDR